MPLLFYISWKSRSSPPSPSFEVLPHAIKVLQGAGYKLVTVAECLGKAPYQSVGPPGVRDVSFSGHVCLLLLMLSSYQGFMDVLRTYMRTLPFLFYFLPRRQPQDTYTLYFLLHSFTNWAIMLCNFTHTELAIVAS
jgi:hypothetical protein